MLRKITLRVLGVDLDNEQTILAIADRLADLVWTVVDSRVCAAVILDQSQELVCRAIEAARRIETTLPGARVDQVDQELVGISDIAARVKLNRETVRSWATGARGPGDFPPPVGSTGGGERGSAKIWRWAEVNDWLDRRYSLGDGYSYASAAEFAEVSAYLARADYILVAHVQNGPPVLSAFSYSVASQGANTLTVTSAVAEEANYLAIGHCFRT
jgi:hypothetical protein